VVAVGATFVDPLAAVRVPLTPLIVTEVAPVVAHESESPLPALIEAADAVNELMTGAGTTVSVVVRVLVAPRELVATNV
jgi:hypothetical protein